MPPYDGEALYTTLTPLFPLLGRITARHDKWRWNLLTVAPQRTCVWDWACSLPSLPEWVAGEVRALQIFMDVHLRFTQSRFHRNVGNWDKVAETENECLAALAQLPDMALEDADVFYGRVLDRLEAAVAVWEQNRWQWWDQIAELE